MIEKLVRQFKCEYCGKKQYAKGAMRAHEAHCTNNPARKCRLCERVEVATGGAKEGVELSELVAALRDREMAPLARMTAVRALTDCPACMLAAIRQSGIWVEYLAADNEVASALFYSGGPVGVGKFLGFDFQEEKKAILEESRQIDFDEWRSVVGY